MESRMLKTVLTILLLATSGSALAKWVQVGGNDDIATYVDPTTIRKSGNKVKMWTLMDYSTQQQHKISDQTGKPYRSGKIQEEYDCKEEQSRMLYFSCHSENMGAGDVVCESSDATKNWIPVPPGSLEDTILKFACKKR